VGEHTSESDENQDMSSEMIPSTVTIQDGDKG